MYESGIVGMQVKKACESVGVKMSLMNRLRSMKLKRQHSFEDEKDMEATAPSAAQRSRTAVGLFLGWAFVSWLGYDTGTGDAALATTAAFFGNARLLSVSLNFCSNNSLTLAAASFSRPQLDCRSHACCAQAFFVATVQRLADATRIHVSCYHYNRCLLTLSEPIFLIGILSAETDTRESVS